jgi:hypothetical protein
MTTTRHFTNTNALTLDQVRHYAPSAFAVEAHASRTSRYEYISTAAIMGEMEAVGFLPYKATQSRTRIADRAEHTKHMIRFRHADNQSIKVGDTLPEVVLINSHDGSSAYSLMLGMFRLVCMNGLVISEGNCESVHVRHSGNVIDAVLEGSLSLIEKAPQVLSTIQDWKTLQLGTREQLAFAEAARSLRFADSDGTIDTPITPAQLLSPRRSEDNKPDLWSTLNRVQENVIQGGLSARGERQPNGRRGRRTTMREVRGIDQDVRLNRAMWALAEKMAELKSA